MEFGPDDLVMFGLYYVPSLGLALLAALLLLIAPLIGKRLRPGFVHWPVLFFCVPVPLIWFVFHLVATCGFARTLVLLNSESSQVAERTYDNSFRWQVKTVDEAVRLAVGRCQPPNVRFYASCLIADMLATDDVGEAAKVLERVETAPAIGTQFFGGNRLTEKFYVPGHEQVHLAVGDIIERRLEDIRKGATR